MARYIVATHRELRGQVNTAADAVNNLSGASIRGDHDTNRVEIESADSIETIRKILGEAYNVEEDYRYDLLN